MNLTLHSNKESIQIADNPFAGGGEGNLYRILAPKALRNFVVKMYHPEKRTPLRTQKMHYLLKHPPAQLQLETAHPPVVWPIDLVYDKEELMGFVMPFIAGEKLELLCTPKLPRKVDSDWKRFAFDNPEALQLRLRLCFNIATALYQVHSTGRYVLVDLKPDNVVIQPNGLVSLVDMDSVEVVEDGQVLFPAPVATPEYTPPEHYHPRNHQNGVDTSWDHFSMAVIFYKLLLGIHPFAASALPPYDKATALQDMIQHGLFVHSPARQQVFRIIPPLHHPFIQLDKGLKELFLLCFEQGHHSPLARPTAEDWCLHFFNCIEHSEEERERFGNALFAKSRKLGLNLPIPSKALAIRKYSGDNLNNLLPKGLLLLEKTSPDLSLSIPEPRPNELIKVKQVSAMRLIIFIPLIFILLEVIGALALLLIPLVLIIGLPVLYYYREFPKTYHEWKVKLLNLRDRFQQFEGAEQVIRQRLLSMVPKELPSSKKLVHTVNTALEKVAVFVQNRDPEFIALKEEAISKYQELEQQYWEKAFMHPWLSPLPVEKFSSLLIMYQHFYREAQQKILALRNGFNWAEHAGAFDKEKRAIEKKYGEMALNLDQEMARELEAYQQLAKEDKDEYWELVEVDADIKTHYFQKFSPPMHNAYGREFLSWMLEKGFHSILQLRSFQSGTYLLLLDDGRELNISYWTEKIKNLMHHFKLWKKEIDALEMSYQKICAETDAKLANTISTLSNKKALAIKQLDRQAEQELQYLRRQVEQAILQPKIEAIHAEYTNVLEFIKSLLAEKDLLQDRLIEKLKKQHSSILSVCKAQLEEVETLRKAEEDAFRIQVNDILSSTLQKELKRYEDSLKKLEATKTELLEAEFESRRYVMERKSVQDWLFGV